jgi:hypothetical protein
MKRTFDSLISQPLAAPEGAWATLPGDLVRLLAGAEPSLLRSLFVLSKHFHVSLALAPPMSALWRDYCLTLIGLSDHVADVAKGTTWKDIVLASPDLPRVYYAKVARARFPCGAMRPDYCGFVCRTPYCGLTMPNHRAVEWVEEKVRLCFNPLERSSRRVAPAYGCQFGAKWSYRGTHKYVFNEEMQSIDLWRRLNDMTDYVFSSRVALSPAVHDPEKAWCIDQFYGFV